MLTQLGLAEISAKLRAREVSAREVAEAHLERINQHDPLHNAFLTVDPERTVAEADRAQEMLDAGDAPHLCGVPVAVKDNISTSGCRTTCGSRILEDYVPVFDATVVESLARDGAVMIGKTNLDEFAMGSSCENSAFFPTRNPWDPDRAAGGSSGGSAVAVAAEMATVALGSDTGGSVRMPAALCGVVGFKPTYGRVSRFGLVAFASSLDQIGPFGRSVEDVALLTEAVSGHDPRDSTSLPDSKVDTSQLKDGRLKSLRVGLPKQLFGGAVQPGVRDALEMTLDHLKKEGVEFTEMDLPSLDLGVTTYYIIAPAEASSNLARFDGIRFGGQVGGKGHEEMVAATRGKLFGHEVKLRIMVGTYALSAGYYDAYYHRAQQVRGLMTEEIQRAFHSVDVLLSPTSPVTAFRLGELGSDPLALKLLDLCTIPANLGGFPSVSVPCGFAQDLPVGMCLTGPLMEDERLLQVAHTMERALPWGYRRPPMP